MLGARSGNAHGALEATLGQTAVGFTSYVGILSPKKARETHHISGLGLQLKLADGFGAILCYIMLYFHVAIFPGKP
jgi:hypothetical protein